MEAACDNIPGQAIHPINPSVSVQTPGKPTFLFESTFLVTLSCNLFQELRPKDQRNLPIIKQSESFPYRSAGVSFPLSISARMLILLAGGASFVCKVSNDAMADLDRHANCSRCGPSVKLDWKRTQRILEHMGACHGPTRRRLLYGTDYVSKW